LRDEALEREWNEDSRITLEIETKTKSDSPKSSRLIKLIDRLPDRLRMVVTVIVILAMCAGGLAQLVPVIQEFFNHDWNSISSPSPQPMKLRHFSPDAN